MVIKQVELQHVCGITSKLPDTGQVEVAFAGKSNVGKSSLINALMNRKSLARTSAQPGKNTDDQLRTTSMRKCIWWICRDTGFARDLRGRLKQNGAS